VANSVEGTEEAHRVSNDEVLAFNASGGGPERRRPGLDEFGRFAFQFRIFLDSFDGNLEADG